MEARNLHVYANENHCSSYSLKSAQTLFTSEYNINVIESIRIVTLASNLQSIVDGKKMFAIIVAFFSLHQIDKVAACSTPGQKRASSTQIQARKIRTRILHRSHFCLCTTRILRKEREEKRIVQIGRCAKRCYGFVCIDQFKYIKIIKGVYNGWRIHTRP